MTDDITDDAALDELGEDELVEDEPILDDELLDDDAYDDETEAAEDEDEDGNALPLDVSEDGDDELSDEPAVDLAAIDESLEVDDPTEVDEEDEDDEDDSIRDGEFVCTSCHMAKRASALADEDQMLCRDCV